MKQLPPKQEIRYAGNLNDFDDELDEEEEEDPQLNKEEVVVLKQ